MALVQHHATFNQQHQTNSKQDLRTSRAELGFETAWDFIILLHHHVEIKQQYRNHMATHIMSNKTRQARELLDRV